MKDQIEENRVKLLEPMVMIDDYHNGNHECNTNTGIHLADYYTKIMEKTIIQQTHATMHR